MSAVVAIGVIAGAGYGTARLMTLAMRIVSVVGN